MADRDLAKEADDILAEYEGRNTEPQAGIRETEASKSARENASGWAKAALPMAGAALGAVAAPAAGAALGIARGARALPMLGEIAGSVAGEGLNQLTGITEPSAGNLALNAIAPVAGRAIGAMPQGALRLLPDSVKAIRAGLVDRATAAPNIIRTPPSKKLYDQIPMQGGVGSFRSVDMPETAQTTLHLRNELDNPIKALSAKRDSIKPVLDQIDGMLEGANRVVQPSPPGGRPFSIQTGLPKQEELARAPGLDFNELRTMTEDIGRRIRGTADPELRGAYRQLYKGVLSDLEKMPRPAGQAIDTWNKARTAYKKELAKTQLAEVIETKGIKSVEGVDSFQADKIIDFVRTNKDFRKRVDPGELAAIEKELRNLASYTGKRSNKLFTMLLGGTVGTLAGGAGGGISGVTAGYVLAEVLSNALMKPGARKLLTKLVTMNEGRAGRDAGAILAAGAAGALGNDPEVE